MAPIKGRVVDTSAGLTIRLLASRALVEVPEHPTLRLGDICYVLYNYESMEPTQVLSEEEVFKADEVEPDLGEEEEPDEAQAWIVALLSDGLSCCFS